MWARISELFLGLWLLLSHFLLSAKSFTDLIAAGLILLFATLSFYEKLNKLHLLEIFPIGWLFYLGYSDPTPSFAAQNHILVALSLFMFAILPSRASDPPRPWKRFLQGPPSE